MKCYIYLKRRVFVMCGMGVRASISKPTPFIYLAFEKTDPFIYLIVQNVDLFIYCPLIFIPIYYQKLDKYPYRSQFIEYQENKQPRKSLSENYTHVRKKMGPFTYESRKIGSFIHPHLEEERPFYCKFLKSYLFITHRCFTGVFVFYRRYCTPS